MSLLFSVEKYGWDQERFWLQCKNHKKTFVLIKSNFNKIFGIFVNQKWERIDSRDKNLRFYFKRKGKQVN